MIRMETTLVIDRPVADVWAYFEEPANVREWQGGVTEVRKETDGPVGVGTRLTEVRHFAGKRIESTLEVTAHEPERRFDLRVVKGPIPFEIEHTFEPVDGQTRVTFSGSGEPGGRMKLAEPLLKRQAQKAAEDDFARLKKILESR